jgi:ribosome-associated protein
VVVGRPPIALATGFRVEEGAAKPSVIYNEDSARVGPTTNDQRRSTLCMKKSDLKRQVTAAIQACLDKKAEELSILEMEKGSGAFTDYFVLCSGTNPRQVQAIADEVELRLKGAGVRPAHVEGYKQGEWILVDYLDFVVHVFSEKARQFYDLERLWKTAKRLEPSELKPVARTKMAPKARTTPPKRTSAAPVRRKKV